MLDATDIVRRAPLLIDQQPAEEESSFLGTIGSGLLSGLGMLGNVLDLPGSMFRDVAAGENPFDQWLDPLSHWETGSSVGGRDMLARNLLTGQLFTENKETGMAGWLDDPMEGVQDIAGFAAELAMDPFSWLPGMAAVRAASKGGKALKVTAAGAEAVRAGSKTTQGVTRVLDKAMDVVNTLDPGYHVGKMIQKKAGHKIDPFIIKRKGQAGAAITKGKRAVQRWANEYEMPTTPMNVLQDDLEILKAGPKPSVARDAEVLTQLTPVQQLGRRVGAGFGVDVHYYGGGKESGAALGVSIGDFSNRIWVSGDQLDGGILNVVSHEMLHAVKNTDPDAFNDLVGSILETVDNPQRFMKDAMESYPGWENLADEVKAEEGVAMLAGAMAEDSGVWKRLVDDPKIAPVLQNSFREAMKLTGKHTTSGEAKKINDMLGDFFFGQRATTAGGSDPGKLAQGVMDSFFDLDRIEDYQKGMSEAFPSTSGGTTRIQRGGMVAKDIAQAAVRNMMDITGQLGVALTGSMNYKVLGRTTREVQAMGRMVTGKFEDVGPMLAEPVMAISNELVHHGLMENMDVLDGIRYAVENDEYHHLAKHFGNVEDSENLQIAVRHLKKMFAKVKAMGESVGIKQQVLDDFPDFFPRNMTPRAVSMIEEIEGSIKGGGDNKLFAISSTGKRQQYFRGAITGTNTINEITGSRKVIDSIRNGKGDKAAEFIRTNWQTGLDPRLPHTETTAEGTKFLVQGTDGDMRWIEEGELFREFERIDPGIDMHNDLPGRMNEFGQEIRMSRKNFTAEELGDLNDLDPDVLRQMGIEEEMIGGLDEMGAYSEEELLDFTDDLTAAVAEKSHAAQNINLVTHVTPMSEDVAKNFNITGGAVRDRAAGLKDWMLQKGKNGKGIVDVLEAEGGLYRNNALAEAANRLQNEAYKYSVADSLPKLFSQLIDEGTMFRRTSGIGTGIQGDTLKNIFDTHFAHLDRDKIYNKIRSHNKTIDNLAKDFPEQWKDLVGDMHVPREIVTDLTAVKDFMQLPDTVQGVMNLFRSSTAAFKAGVLSAPARHSRDFFSGQIQNHLAGIFSFESGARMMDVLFDNPSEALRALDQLREYAERNGMKEAAKNQRRVGDAVSWEPTPARGQPVKTVESKISEIRDVPVGSGPPVKMAVLENGNKVRLDRLNVIDNGEDWFTPEMATKAAREWYGALKGDASNVQRDVNLEEVGRLFTEASGGQNVAEALPGTHGSLRSMARDVMDHVIFRKGSKNPIDVEGVQYFTGARAKAGNVRRRGQEGFEEFGWVAASGIVNKNADDANRIVGWLEGMRQGASGKDAFEKVTRVQLDYRPHTFGPLEKVALKRIFPFYSFFSRQSAFLASELMHNPGGRLGKLIRAQHHATSTGENDEQYVPEHVRKQMALPLGESADGGQNYLTGIGLMHEDPVATIMGGLADPQAGARNLLSKMNPMIKGLAEYGLGRSSFQGGPLGGRDLVDMDPSMGRILTQLGIREPTPSGRATPFISRGLEFAVSNSPISRVVSSTKTALDSRKSLLERAANLLTGLKIETVSPEQSRSALRDIGNAIARDAGARSFETFHVPQSLIDYFADDPETQRKLLAINKKREQWNKERRVEIKRKKQEKEGTTY